MDSEKQLAIYEEFESGLNSNIVVSAGPGSGKEQPIFCKVQTPMGPINIGDLKKGDSIFSICGNEQIVKEVYPQGKKPYYRVTFSDNSFTFCGKEHLWKVRYGKAEHVLTLNQIISKGYQRESSIGTNRKRSKYKIPLCEPVNYTEKKLEIDPYILGFLIGDGSLAGNTPAVSINSHEKELKKFFTEKLSNKYVISYRKTSLNCYQGTIVDIDKKYSNSKNSMMVYLRDLGLDKKSHDKFIPEKYKVTSIEQRLLMLGGLMDSDGSTSRGRTSFSTTSEKLKEDIINLVQSLGGIAKSRKPDTRNRVCYDINIKTNFNPFIHSIKKNLWVAPTKYKPCRYIDDIEYIGQCQQVCISVSDNSSLYLTDSFIVTHNTTTLMGVLKRVKEKTLFLSFNKDIRDSTQAKIVEEGLATYGKAMTVHSLGLRSLYSQYKKVTVNKNKSWLILDTLRKKTCRKLYKYLDWEGILEINRSLTDADEISRLFLTNDIKVIKEHCKVMDRSFTENGLIDLLWEAYLKEREKLYENKNEIVIDFVDMVYLPIRNDIKIKIDPTYLLIDEIQDLSYLLIQFIYKLINQGDIKKTVWVGDKKQSIYLFSGAYSKSFQEISDRDNTVVLPLDVCYRCPTDIIEHCNELYPSVLPFKKSKGKINNTSSLSAIEDEALVICRNTKPLIKLYFELVNRKIPVQFKGDDIFSKALSLMSGTKKITAISDLTDKLIKKRNKLGKSKTEQGKINYHIFMNAFDDYKMIVSNMCFGGDTIEILQNKIKDLRKPVENAVILCTIHRSKGLEAEHVVVLNPDLMPSKHASSEEAKIQEKNIEFVARSRTKNTLTYLHLK